MRLNDHIVDLNKDSGLYHEFLRVFDTMPVRPTFIYQTGASIDTLALLQRVFIKIRISKNATPRTKICEVSQSRAAQIEKEFADQTWIKVHHSLPIETEKAMSFIESDPPLTNPEAFPEIIFDAAEPVNFYRTEANGDLYGDNKTPDDRFFEKFISKEYKRPPMFILRGIGGLGWAEFQEVNRLMGGRKYWLFISDIEHVKHFRTYQELKKDPRWWIKAEREGQWALAIHHHRAVQKRFLKDRNVYPRDTSFEI